MLAEMMMNMREGLLAIATGAVAGGFANFFILRRTWLNAQALGDRSDGYVVELRKLHGKYDDVQREPVRAPVNRPPPLLPFAPLRRGCAAPQSGSANREPATLPAPAFTRRTLASAHSAWRCRACSTFGCGATCQTLGTAGLSAFTRRRAGGCSRAKGAAQAVSVGILCHGIHSTHTLWVHNKCDVSPEASMGSISELCRRGPETELTPVSPPPGPAEQ